MPAAALRPHNDLSRQRFSKWALRGTHEAPQSPQELVGICASEPIPHLLTQHLWGQAWGPGILFNKLPRGSNWGTTAERWVLGHGELERSANRPGPHSEWKQSPAVRSQGTCSSLTREKSSVPSELVEQAGPKRQAHGLSIFRKRVSH